jgi:DNA-binding NarL/FixJ family response regulator
MSAPTGTPEDIATLVPERWQTFLRSGEQRRARGALHADGAEVPVELLARLEFTDPRQLTIHLALAEGAPEPAPDRGAALVKLLTARERAVIALIAAGQETQEIACSLHVSPATVRTHVRNAMAKLGAHTRAQLVAVVMADRDPIEIPHPVDVDSVKSPE